MRDPLQHFTIKVQQRTHRVAYQSARTDLLGLEELGLLNRVQIGKEFVFTAVAELTDRIQDLAHRRI